MAVTSGYCTEINYNDSVWMSWTTATSATTISSCAVYYGSDQTWNSWNSGCNSTSISANTYMSGDSYTIWGNWNHVSQRHGIQEETDEQRLQRQCLEERMRQNEVERQRKYAEADEKAKKLLEECLDEEQKKTFRKDSFFLFEVKSGNRYKINKGCSRNIQQVDKEGKVLRHLCIHPRNNVPVYDTMLAQKLALEAEEEKVLKVANIS